MAQNELKPCNCIDWDESMPQIEGAQLMYALHSYGGEYTGKQFIYCPWCGKKREVNNANGTDASPFEEG